MTPPKFMTVFFKGFIYMGGVDLSNYERASN